MTKNFLSANGRFERISPPVTELLFIGEKQEFSPGFISMVVGEMGAHLIGQRADLYRNLEQLVEDLDERSIVFVDAHLLDPDRDLARVTQSLTCKGHLVLTYRNLEVAQHLLRPVLSAARAETVSFLPRHLSLDLLFAALKVIANRGAFCPFELVLCLASLNGRRTDLPGHGLTKRELEVIDLVASGLTNKAVANRLDISETTVKLHVSNLIRKLEVKNRTGAVCWYLSS